MSNNHRSKSMTFLFVSVLAMLLPLSILWYRNLPFTPIHADTADQLWVQLFKQQHNHIEQELGRHSSRPISQKESSARWNILKQSVVKQGATVREAQSVVDEARSYRPTVSNGVAAPHWPILIQKGFVRDKRVWVSVCAASARSYSLLSAPGCFYWVRVVDPDNPRELNGKFSSNQSFIRE